VIVGNSKGRKRTEVTAQVSKNLKKNLNDVAKTRLHWNDQLHDHQNSGGLNQR
jgi:hypothetical protein